MLPRHPNIVKRRRVEVACSPCRRKKSKCDGQRPCCAICQRDGLTCLYEEARSTEIPPPRGQSDAQERIARLEREVAAARRACTENTVEPVGALPPSDVGCDFGSRKSHHTRLNISEDEAAIDALATTAFSHEPEVDIGHFGGFLNRCYTSSLTVRRSQL
jgi:hypothetical protein